MILFTGHGDIAKAFSNKYPCEIVSLRNMTVEKMEKILSAYDTIIHNAANLHPVNTEQAINDNFILTKNIVDALCRVNPGARFIYLSSMSILKSSNEYMDPLQMTEYALSKYLGEIYTLKCALKNATSVRFSTIFYGNPEKDGLSKLLVDAHSSGKVTMLNNGVAKRDFLPLSMLIDYLYGICTTETVQKIYTVCSGVSTSFAQVVNIIRKKMPGLVVENKMTENEFSVLSEFSAEDVAALKIEAYDLEYYIHNCLDRLSVIYANPNL